MLTILALVWMFASCLTLVPRLCKESYTNAACCLFWPQQVRMNRLKSLGVDTGMGAAPQPAFAPLPPWQHETKGVQGRKA